MQDLIKKTSSKKQSYIYNVITHNDRYREKYTDENFCNHRFESYPERNETRGRISTDYFRNDYFHREIRIDRYRDNTIYYGPR